MWYNLDLLMPLGNHSGFMHFDHLCTCLVCCFTWIVFRLLFSDRWHFLLFTQRGGKQRYTALLQDSQELCTDVWPTIQNLSALSGTWVWHPPSFFNCFCVTATQRRKGTVELWWTGTILTADHVIFQLRQKFLGCKHSDVLRNRPFLKRRIVFITWITH